MAPAAAPIWHGSNRANLRNAWALRAGDDAVRRVRAVMRTIAIDDEIRVVLPERLREDARRAERQMRLKRG